MIIKSNGRHIALISNWNANIRRLSAVAQAQVKVRVVKAFLIFALVGRKN